MNGRSLTHVKKVAYGIVNDIYFFIVNHRVGTLIVSRLVCISHHCDTEQFSVDRLVAMHDKLGM